MGDVAGRAPLPPLLAYTASKQKELSDRKGKGKQFGKVKSGISKAAGRNKIGISQVYNKNNTSQAFPRPRPRKPEKKIDFDESARKEYLTGFQKRKQARIIRSKEKAKERERQEHKQLRSEAREARKKQAAENVAAEKVAYGDAEGGSEGEELEGEGEASNEEGPALPSAFETEQHHTTVTIQDWDPNESESEQVEPAKKRTVVQETLPPSSRRMAKKLKNDKELSRANEISQLMEIDEEPVAVDRLDEDNEEDRAHHWRGLLSISEQANAEPAKKAKKPKFHYESKLDRAKARSQARESKMKFAEKRREERNAAGPKGRMQKNKGKRGHGSKGSKKKP